MKKQKKEQKIFLKALSAALVLAMVLSLLVGCGNSAVQTENDSHESVTSDSQTSDNSAADQSKEESTKQEEMSEEPVASKEEYEEQSETQTKPEATTDDIFAGAYAIEETVIFDENDVKITVTDIEYTGKAAKLNLVLENNSTQSAEFLSGTWSYNVNSINGYMYSFYVNETVAAGMKAKKTINISIDDMALYGFKDIADIEIGFQIEIGEADPIYTGPVRMTTELAADYDYEKDTFMDAMESGLMGIYGIQIDKAEREIFYENSGIRATGYLFATNASDEKLFLMELKNESDVDVYVTARDLGFNGLCIYSGAWSGETILKGKREIVKIRLTDVLDANYAEALNLEKVGEINFALRTTNKNTDKQIGEDQLISLHTGEESEGYNSDGIEVYNDNNIKIIIKGIYEEDSDYSDDLHVLGFVENLGEEEFYIYDKYDSTSLNGFMTTAFFYGQEVPPGATCFLNIEFPSYYYEDLGISSVDDVTEMGITLQFAGDRDYIDEPAIRAHFDHGKAVEENAVTEKETESSTVGQTEESASTTEEETASTEVRTEIKEALDSYEEFIDSYCEFMETADYTNTEWVSDYMDMLTEVSEMAEKMDALEDDYDLTEAEKDYYIEVLTRCAEKMTNVGS